MTDHLAFHQAREIQERRRADALSPGAARNLHAEMADLHRDLARSLTVVDLASADGHEQRRYA